jgi:hypothetical protein
VTTINCIVEEKGARCSTTIEVTEQLSSGFKFICKNHPRAVQVRASGRVYDPVKDNVDKDVRFQEKQFDKDLGKLYLRKPIGTEHIVVLSPAAYRSQSAPERAFKKTKNE